MTTSTTRIAIALAGGILVGVSGCAAGAGTGAEQAASAPPTVTATRPASVQAATPATPSVEPAPAPAPPAAPTAPTGPEAPASSDIRITFTVNGTAVNAVLAPSAASTSLLAQLPLELSFDDFGGQEKIAGIPSPLALDGLPTGGSAEPGTIGYYAPDQAIVLYYDSVGYYEGIIPLGTFDGVATVRDAPPFEATLTATPQDDAR
ncbi:cyclophilin-like fold protein [Herbiconiux sp. P15]|uniref:cyclophilin-like fold protein n=1 Tax=Herbiconiux liukaitaii TaxID=3342799 RepID=UPI0035B6BD0B